MPTRLGTDFLIIPLSFLMPYCLNVLFVSLLWFKFSEYPFFWSFSTRTSQVYHFFESKVNQVSISNSYQVSDSKPDTPGRIGSLQEITAHLG